MIGVRETAEVQVLRVFLRCQESITYMQYSDIVPVLTCSGGSMAALALSHVLVIVSAHPALVSTRKPPPQKQSLLWRAAFVHELPTNAYEAAIWNCQNATFNTTDVKPTYPAQTSTEAVYKLQSAPEGTEKQLTSGGKRAA